MSRGDGSPWIIQDKMDGWLWIKVSVDIYNYTKYQKNQIYTSSSSLSISDAFFFFWSDKNIPH